MQLLKTGSIFTSANALFAGPIGVGVRLARQCQYNGLVRDQVSLRLGNGLRQQGLRSPIVIRMKEVAVVTGIFNFFTFFIFLLRAGAPLLQVDTKTHARAHPQHALICATLIRGVNQSWMWYPKQR